ncbi:MAG: hypothetical protein HC888_02245 [Candidatus Competibacteraceae bacterium]|nr:hypothetical protein [Candidatus Competibacteraceae bacterium]
MERGLRPTTEGELITKAALAVSTEAPKRKKGRPTLTEKMERLRTMVVLVAEEQPNIEEPDESTEVEVVFPLPFPPTQGFESLPITPTYNAQEDLRLFINVNVD